MNSDSILVCVHLNKNLGVASVTMLLPNPRFSYVIRKESIFRQNTVSILETPSSFMTADIRESDDDQGWCEEPGELLYEPDLESGRTIRKKKSYSLSRVKRKAPEQTPDKEMPTESSVNAETCERQEALLIPFHCPCCKTQATMNDASTQKDGSSHQRMSNHKISKGRREC